MKLLSLHNVKSSISPLWTATQFNMECQIIPLAKIPACKRSIGCQGS